MNKPNNKTEFIGFKCNEELSERLEGQAFKEDRSVSSLIRNVLNAYFDALRYKRKRSKPNA